jgi:amino acid transporter
VTIGAQMLVPDHVIVATKEAAFVAVGRAALGAFGRWAAIVGAVFATGSAINATLFSTARLTRDASAAGELPPFLGRETNGLPIVAMSFIAIAGGAMAMLPRITSVIVFGSGSFLAVYAIVNYLQARTAARRSDRVVAWIAAATCVAALADLLVELARNDRAALTVVAALVVALASARAVFVRKRADAA